MPDTEEGGPAISATTQERTDTPQHRRALSAVRIDASRSLVWVSVTAAAVVLNGVVGLALLRQPAVGPAPTDGPAPTTHPAATVGPAATLRGFVPVDRPTPLYSTISVSLDGDLEARITKLSR